MRHVFLRLTRRVKDATVVLLLLTVSSLLERTRLLPRLSSMTRTWLSWLLDLLNDTHAHTHMRARARDRSQYTAIFGRLILWPHHPWQDPPGSFSYQLSRDTTPVSRSDFSATRVPSTRLEEQWRRRNSPAPAIGSQVTSDRTVCVAISRDVLFVRLRGSFSLVALVASCSHSRWGLEG
jgi:hypothetical protein